MKRPRHLPDFQTPPLDEVVIGMQFHRPNGYMQINAADVRRLFVKQFPLVQEHPALPPQFEIFGREPQFNFGIIDGAMHDRFWFVSADDSELIQFQGDRLIHNWRKRENSKNEYPRFDNMIKKYQREIQKLDKYMRAFDVKGLSINQCELTYTNKIDLNSDRKSEDFSNLFSFLDFGALNFDDFRMNFRSVLSDKEGQPYGRLICDMTTAKRSNDDKGIIQLALTVRGAARDGSISAGIDFLTESRDLIVLTFDDMASQAAHQRWGRV